jgi:hypothetical protein
LVPFGRVSGAENLKVSFVSPQHKHPQQQLRSDVTFPGTGLNIFPKYLTTLIIVDSTRTRTTTTCAWGST